MLSRYKVRHISGNYFIKTFKFLLRKTQCLSKIRNPRLLRKDVEYSKSVLKRALYDRLKEKKRLRKTLRFYFYYLQQRLPK